MLMTSQKRGLRLLLVREILPSVGCRSGFAVGEPREAIDARSAGIAMSGPSWFNDVEEAETHERLNCPPDRTTPNSELLKIAVCALEFSVLASAVAHVFDNNAMQNPLSG